jgi:hypothetical protein
MAEAWREVARLGKVGHQYPHILADSRGWCLRWGPKTERDEKYFSSLSSLLHGLAEHYLRRRLGAGEDIRTLARFRELVELTMKEASVLGAALDRKLQESRLRPVDASERCATSPGSDSVALAPGIVADPAGSPSKAA